MSDELVFGEEIDEEPASSARLPAAVCAIAGFALAVSALMGQSIFSVGITALVGTKLSESLGGYFTSTGIAVGVQAIVALLVSAGSFRSRTSWEANLGRAAALVALLALLGAAFTVVGAALNGAGAM